MKPSRHFAVPALLILGLGMTAPRTSRAASPENGRPAGVPRAVSGARLSDSEILGVVDTVNAGAIAQANIALKRAGDESVKQLAGQMLKDYSESRQKARALGLKLGISPSPSGIGNAVEKESDDVTSRLETTSAPSFDRTYVRTQIRLDQKIAKTLERLAPQAAPPPLHALVVDMSAQVERHLASAQRTLETLGG